MPSIDYGYDAGTFAPTSPTYNRIGSERCFGIELEYNDISRDWEDMENCSIFGAKEDCSVSGGEFYSPILYGDQGLAAVDEFCQAAESKDFDAGTGAGYHIHLDMRNESAETLKRIALGYHYNKMLWLGMVPRRRREYTYSKSHNWVRSDVVGFESMRDVDQFVRDKDRYHWFNTHAYYSHKTFEIRCHEGVNDAKSVNSWAIAHTRFADAMAAMSVGKITRMFGRKDVKVLFRELVAIVKDAEVTDHLRNRYRQYN